MKPITIGKVAERAEIGIETVRFYEREGLIAEPSRSKSGYRQYDHDVVNRLRFIGRAKELGFTLNEIKELLALRIDSDKKCDDVMQRAEAKIKDMEAKIRTLQRMKRALKKLATACGERGSSAECPILESLERK